jgi:hypothetical protein
MDRFVDDATQYLGHVYRLVLDEKRNTLKYVTVMEILPISKH